jgi:RNA polymerase sigma-70 factor, ECF subfamily
MQELDHPGVIQSAASGVGMGVKAATLGTWPERTGFGLVRPGAPMADGGETPAGRHPADLISAIAVSQDRFAFAALFELYAPRIKSMLMRIGATPEAAEDIAQETLLMVWRKAAYFDPGRASASAWVYTIARNLRIDLLRRDKRAKLHALYDKVEPEEPERPDGALDAMEREHRVRAALGQLSDEQIRVVQLSFFEGRPHRDISEHLDIPLGTVKSRLRLAMNRLTEFLGDLS